MPTAMNTTVKVYKGVPLIKGGTEVLYLAQGAAEGALSAYLHKTYTEYYYTRENRGTIQVHDIIPNLEGCNYVSFANLSHGGKIFFGFIDSLVYINDNNTEIHFTIDPFPTYLGDCTERDRVFLVRNTVKSDSLNYIAEDFDFEGEKLNFMSLSHTDLALSQTVTLFTAGRLVNDDGVVVEQTSNIAGTFPVQLYGHNTGIQGKLDMQPDDVRIVNQAGGSIIGCYALDAGFQLGTPTSFEIAGAIIFTTVRHLKLNTGQYNKIILVVAGQSKVYDLNFFSSAPRIAFTVRRILAPVPYLAVIPMDYKGIAQNTAEAMVVEYPSLAFAVGNTHDTASVVNTAFDSLVHSMMKTTTMNEEVSKVNNLGSEGGSGMNIGQLGNWLFHPLLTAGTAIGKGLGYVGAGMSALPDALANASRAIGTARKATRAAEISSSTGSLVLSVNNNISIDIMLARHTNNDIEFLDKYFDYYGYALNRFDTPNTDDNAYLQTGSEMLSGSEVDVLLNNYLARGIKIKKSLP